LWAGEGVGANEVGSYKEDRALHITVSPLLVCACSVARYATAVSASGLSTGAYSIIPAGTYVTAALDAALSSLFTSVVPAVKSGSVPATSVAYV
jgi:hypothetical protein